MIWGDVEMGKCKNGLIKIGEMHSWENAQMGKKNWGDVGMDKCKNG